MHSQVHELQNLGVDVHVACEKTLNLDQFMVKNLHVLANESIWNQLWDRSIRRMRLRNHLAYTSRIGREIGADIIHSHFGNIGWANIEAAEVIGARHVVTFYGQDVNQLPTTHPIWRHRYRRLFQRADLFLCEGSHMANSLVHLGCPMSKIRVQHLGVDIDGIPFRPRIWRPGEPLRILIAASFREKKGIPYALEAIGMLDSSLEIELTIIGDAGSQKKCQLEKAKILKALSTAKLQDRTRFLGYQSHKILMREAYNNHLFIQPSLTASDGDTEGGAPVSIIEMMATGMPIVSTWHCDIPEVVGEAYRPFLAQERDAHGLSIGISELLGRWREWCDMTEMARKHVEKEYHRLRQAERLMDHYRQIVTGVHD
jgi:colanic acid/amylovoran biosynthesis glycosyltransferase